jgi:hypothetical protein
VGEALSRLGVRSVVHAYCGAESWLPPVVARMAADEAAREELAALQRQGGDGRGGSGRGRGAAGAAAVAARPGAESASLGAQSAGAAKRRALDHAGLNSSSSAADDEEQPPTFFYFGLDSACDQVQARRRALGAGDFAHRPATRPRARPRRPRVPPPARHVSWRFECLDAAHQGLPSGADVVATHDTLEHLPIESAFVFLSSVKASGAKYLLIGGFANGTAPNREPRPEVSGYYALDTSQPPFNLQPPPLGVFEEESYDAWRLRLSGGGSGGIGGSSNGIRGRGEVEAAEERSAGRRVVRLYDVAAMKWDDGMFELFNYSRPVQGGGGGSSAGSSAGSGSQQQKSSGGAAGGKQHQRDRGAVGGARQGPNSAAERAGGGGGRSQPHETKRAVPSAKLPGAAAAGGSGGGGSTKKAAAAAAAAARASAMARAAVQQE